LRTITVFEPRLSPPAPSHWRGWGVAMHERSTEEIIPADMATPSPDDRFHDCSYYPVANEFDPWGYPVWGSKAKTRCFFAPMHSS